MGEIMGLSIGCCGGRGGSMHLRNEKIGVIGSKIAEHCQVAFFDYMDGPITTISGLDIPNPVSKKLEQAAVPSLEQIQKTIFKAAKRQL